MRLIPEFEVDEELDSLVIAVMDKFFDGQGLYYITRRNLYLFLCTFFSDSSSRARLSAFLED